MVLNETGYSVHGGKLFIREPSEDEEEIEISGPDANIEAMDPETDLVVKGESAYIQSMQFYGGHLHIQAWTGPRRGDGWMTFVRIPMLAQETARNEVSAMAKPYGLNESSDLDSVGEVLEREVDDYGRINLGRDRAGDTVKVAVLDED